MVSARSTFDKVFLFYLARDKSVISQADNSSGSLSEHRTSFILPAGTRSCIMYMIGQA